MPSRTTDRRHARVLLTTDIAGLRLAGGDILAEPADGRAYIHRVHADAPVAISGDFDFDSLVARGVIEEIEGDVPVSFADDGDVYVAVGDLMLGLHGPIRDGDQVPATWRTSAATHSTDFAELVRRGVARKEER